MNQISILFFNSVFSFCSFVEENAVDTAKISLMVDGRKPFPSQVASSWVTKRDSHLVLPQTMQPIANLSGVGDGGSGSHPILPPRGAGGGGMHPALPPKPKPKPRNTGFSGGDKVAPMNTPIPPPSISTSKPPFSLPPKSEQVLGKNQMVFLRIYFIFSIKYIDNDLV